MNGETKVKKDYVYIKTHTSIDKYKNELFFYKNYKDYTPSLIAYNDDSMTLVIEACTPILEIPNNSIYSDKLRDLLEGLHNDGANHRDVALINVVVKDDRVLLIDWESARLVKDDSKSWDLYGATNSSLEPDPFWLNDYGANCVWWGGPWDICPGKYWNESS